jgi:hypothetical protein
MKKYLKTLFIAALLSVSAMSHAEAPTTGLYTVRLFDDVTYKRLKPWELCIRSDNSWYVKNEQDVWLSLNNYKSDSSHDPSSDDTTETASSILVQWYGGLDNKGNDTHFQSVIYNQSVISFRVSRINKKLFTGYFTVLKDNGGMHNMTISLKFKQSSCKDDETLFPFPFPPDTFTPDY